MIDKVKIARSFSRSAITYDTADYFQRDIGMQLLDLLPENISTVNDINSTCVDLGCGTGSFHRDLKEKYSNASYLGLDIAEGMLQFSREKMLNKQQKADALLCADAEKLPLKNKSIDIVFSNMALQWCESLPILFSEIDRVLKPKGIMAFTTLGPNTLIELKKSWAKVDNLTHVNQFCDVELWKQAIDKNGFNVEHHFVQQPVLQYASIKQLLRELKLIGAHNVNDGQRQTLTGRRRLENLLSAYNDFYTEGFYPATYEVYFWLLKK